MRDAHYPEFALLGDTRLLDLTRVPKSEGIYLFRSEEQAIFVGETSNLQHRIEKHLYASASHGLPEWLYSGREIQLGIHSLPGASQATRKALELKAIQILKPLFNILDQAA
jgi:excinuclease UvrABC nuclease subunit